MKRITRDRRLTPEEAAKYKTIREKVSEELPELIARHHERESRSAALGWNESTSPGGGGMAR